MIKNKISKIAIITMIILITLLLGTLNVVNAANLNLPNRDYVCFKKGINQKLSNGGTVILAQLAGGKNESGSYVSALSLAHVYCAEHGQKVSGRVTYNVYGEYTVEDPVLAYILANGPTDINVAENSYDEEESQLAFWYYLHTQNTADKIRITDNVKQLDNHSGSAKECCSDFKKKNEYYKAAEEYAKNLNSKPTLSLKLDGNNLKVTVDGYFENFDLIINGTAYERTKNKNSSYSENIDISNYSTSSIKVQIKAKKIAYSAKYFVLKHSENQRMIVVTNQTKDGVKEVYSNEKEININTNVSLQKYITHVNNSKITSRANRKADTNTTDAISESIPNSKGTNKIEDIVTIDAGDYVTYEITVYNNSAIKSNVTVTDTLPTGVTIYSVNGGLYKNVPSNRKFNHTINNLDGGDSESFEVTAYFGEYATGTLSNKAEITDSTPNNKTSYRTVDYDYVTMKKYSVSLEKYITEIDSNSGDINNTTDISKYYNIINYLNKNKDKYKDIDALINAYNGKTISFDEKYDINRDGKIDDIDYNIFNTYTKKETFEKINNYVKADINNDGHVDESDLNIYKAIKANLKNDTTLDDNDRYMFILKYMYQNNKNINDELNYLYKQRLLLKSKKTQQEILKDIDNYLKSDINGDGYVTSDDNNIYNDKDITIPEEIKNLDESQIEILRENIARFDINGDDKLDSIDIEIFESLNSKDNLGDNFYYLSQIGYENIINVKNTFYNKIKVDLTEEYIDYELTEDLHIYFDDYIIAKEHLEQLNINDFEDNDDYANVKNQEEELITNIYNLLKIEDSNDRYSEELDFNRDKVIDYTDYELLSDYINYLEYCHIYVQDQNRIESLKNGLISEITITSRDYKYNAIYDLNGDKKIDYDDYGIAKQDDEQISEFIDRLLTVSNTDFDFNGDGYVSYVDYEILTNYYTENIDNVDIHNIILQIETLINEYNISDDFSENKDLSQKDINTILVHKGLKEFNEKYYSENLALYDINQDGLVNENDKTLINNNYETFKDITNSNLLSENNIEYIIDLLKEEYSNIENVEINEIVKKYDDLDKIVNETTKPEEILSNNEYKNKVSVLNYDDIVSMSKIEFETLDINNDGVVDDNDNTNEYPKVFEIDSFDKKQIIEKNDINGDGCVDQSDIEFYHNLKEIAGNSSIQNAITNNSTNAPSNNDAPSNNGSVSGRENHPIYNENGYSKENNKIRLEVGDTVTYTIKLTNTGKNTIKVTQVVDTFDGNNNANLTYIEGSSKGYGTQTVKVEDGKVTINISNAQEIEPGQSKYFTLQFKVDVSKENTDNEQVLKNTAEVTKITNKKDIEVKDSHETDSNGDGKWNNIDSDWVKTHIYKVSLEKYVARVESNGKTTEYNRAGKAEHKYDDDNSTKDSAKANEVVTVQNGDKVTYIIKVTNNSQNTGVYITEITDYLPDGVKYKNKDYTGNQYGINTQTDNAIKFTTLKDTYLRPGEFASFEVTVDVIEDNMSVNIMKNVAEITGMKNKNGYSLEDTTKNNNKDADYIQMRDIIISGTVWNDLALDKTNSKYNGLYDSADEEKLSGIKVYLYRHTNSGNSHIKTTTTDNDGKYSFSLDYIKGPKTKGTNRWNGTYYSYYVVFEYDGIMYTSTPDGKTFKSVNNTQYKVDSNAREKLDNETFDGVVGKSRKQFNNSFSTINSRSGIGYTTTNENGYIPQSNHTFNSSMNMQSSTSLINIGDYTEDQLKYIGLGLRGRDIFDLELTTDVDQIKITVNNEQGVYQNTNTAEFRKSDNLEDKIAKEDMKTAVSERANTYLNNQEQKVRESDYNVDTENAKYKEEQGISHVEVRYKITVKNTSVTRGTATKITNYYDKNYTFVGAYANLNDAENYINELEASNDTTRNNCSCATINTPANMLNQMDTMEIYVVYTLNNPADNLKNINKDNPFVTLNLAEIFEYKTECGQNQTEYTRGLIDKDSAPGSVAVEKVRLSEGTSDLTTLNYYFNRDSLNKFKYEDDTYATPTIFVAAMDDNGTPDNPNDDTYSKRAIVGTVFEDYTRIIGNEDEDIRVKTGDGVQDTTYNIEPGVEGITVRLYEVTSEGAKLRFTSKTNENGQYFFEGYLPGQYIVKYEYGDTNQTFLLDNEPNTKSYNGEDFQSTNNTGSFESNKLDSHELTWYVYNESKGISTATDVVGTRQDVSTNVTNFTDAQMTVLNNARDGMSEKDAKVGEVTVESIRNATQMEALTNKMRLTMEKSILDGNEIKQDKAFKEYVVGNMNFGIAEVPVTTIDMQKHVHSFTITDSTGTNILAGAEIDTDNTSVVVNASKIAVNRLDTVINVLSKNLGITEAKVRNTIKYNENKSKDINITIAQKVDEESKNKLQDDMTKYSLAREIKILYGWKVTAGNVIAAPGTAVLDVSIEDDKLQGAKLEVVYEISANIYAEKNFNNESVTVPTIEGLVDYIDNDLSYDESKNTIEGNNSQYWSVTTYDDVQGLFEGQGNGTLDPEGRKYSTIVSAKEDSAILQKKCGEGKVYITLEKVLSSTDSTLADVILNSVDSYEYTNTVEITKLNYENQTGSGSSDGSNEEGGTGGSGGTSNPDGENDFVFKDRVRTPDRFIIVPGMSHDYESSESISIHPPTGDSSISTVYYVIAAIALTVVVTGIFGIKKFVIKK